MYSFIFCQLVFELFFYSYIDSKCIYIVDDTSIMGSFCDVFSIHFFLSIDSFIPRQNTTFRWLTQFNGRCLLHLIAPPLITVSHESSPSSVLFIPRLLSPNRRGISAQTYPAMLQSLIGIISQFSSYQDLSKILANSNNKIILNKQVNRASNSPTVF